MDSKNDLITYGKTLHFFGWYLLRFVNIITAWTEICKKCSSAIFFDNTVFFAIVRLRGILQSSLNMHKLFGQELY